MKTKEDYSELMVKEAQQVLVEEHDVPLDDFYEETFATLFSRRAQEQLETIALYFEDEQLSYGELERRANQLAHYLRHLGVGPETIVGICLERSIELVIGLLGILKAGGAYVPLDPHYPLERLAYMLTDSQCQVVVTRSALCDRIALCQGHIVCLDREWDQLVRELPTSPESRTAAQNIAYVIYTSGSTGVPKGVLGTYQAALNRFRWMWQAYPFAPDEVCCQKTSLNFVDSVWEIWGPLLQGVPLVLIPETLLHATYQLTQKLAEHQVSRIVLVPSLLQALLENHEDLQKRVPVLRFWVTSGEELASELAHLFLLRMPGCRLLNLYGSSEVAADVTCFEVRPEDVLSVIPIGQPVAHTQVYVLDPQLLPVPPNTIGELYVGGIQLARGYLNRPERTAERFIPHPFAQGEGMRLYRTGDLARFRTDGTLEFMGRQDRQIKLRGHRIELGEIEHALLRHPQVRGAVSLARGDISGDKQLVAYVVLYEQKVTKEELSSYLRSRLPGYMIPSHLLMLERLPLTPNGKIDRLALPVPQVQRSALENAYEPPTTPTEQTLATLWAEILGVEQIGRKDNFFALGGHSVSVMRLIARIRDIFRAELPPQPFFAASDLAAQAALIDEFIAQERDQRLPLEPCSRAHLLPSSSVQEFLWFLSQLTPDHPMALVPVLLRFRGPLNLTILEESIQAIIHRHESLRTTFRIVQGQIIQEIKPTLHLPLATTNFEEFPLSRREEEAQRFIQQQIFRRFDTSRGPLLRLHLLRLEEQSHLLLIVMHHIISDGWSLGVFFKELLMHYEIIQHKSHSFPAPLPVQYADYVIWHNTWFKGEVKQKQLDYWKKQLSGASTTPPPTDGPHPVQRRYQNAIHRFTLPLALDEALRELSRREGTTLFMTLLTGFSALLVKETGQRDILIGTTIARRMRSEIESLIGPFAETLALRIDTTPLTSWRELLGRTREVTVGAYTHQDISSIELARALGYARKNEPLYQILFTMYDIPIQPYSSQELSVSREDFEDVAAFDLEIRVEDMVQELRISILYRVALFSQDKIHQLARDYQENLERFVKDADGAFLD